KRDEVRRPRTRADQSDMPRSRATRQELLSRHIGSVDICSGDGACRRAFEEGSPEVAARCPFGYQPLNSIAPGGGQTRQRAEGGREDAIDARADDLGKNGACAFGANGNRNRCTVDEGGGEEIAKCRTIDRVGGDLLRASVS